MTQLRRQRQSGRFNIVTVIVLLAIAGAAYGGAKFIPVYIEKSRINRLVKQAANEWMNLTPDLDEVKKNLQYNLEAGQIESITADEVNFAKGVNDDEVEAWVTYQVTIKHPWKKIKPTKLKFNIHHTVKRTATSY